MCSCQGQFILAFAWNQRVSLIMFKRSRFMYFWAWHICGWSPFDAHDVISWTDLLLGLSRSSDLEISSQNGFSFLNRAEDDIKSRKNIGKAQTGLPFGKGCLVSRGNEMSRKFFVFSWSINTGIFYLIVLSLLTGWFEIFDFHFICYQFSNCFVVFFPAKFWMLARRTEVLFTDEGFRFVGLAQKLFALLDMHGEKPAVKAEQWKLSRVIYKAIFYKDCAWSCVVQESGVERGVLCPGKRAKNLGKDWESRRRMVFRDLVQIRGGRPKKNKAKWKVRCPFDYCVDRWILNTRRLKLYIQ